MLSRLKFICIAFLSIMLIEPVVANVEKCEVSNEYLKSWVKKNNLTSAVVRIEDLNSHKIDYHSFGKVQLNATSNVRPLSIYGVGSISKTFLSALILKLQEEGKINLSDTVTKYFPEYTRWNKITIHQLLNMTSGIFNFTESKEFKTLSKIGNRNIIHEYELVNLAYSKKDYFPPGSGWHYSNTGYILAGMIIEKITKSKIDNLYEKYFVRPLKLRNSFYSNKFYPESVIKKMANAYKNDIDITNFNGGAYGVAGAMVMNSDDIATWVKSLLIYKSVINNKSLEKFKEVISIPTTPPKPSNSKYGLGIYSLEIPNIGNIWWYTGVIDGYTSVFVYAPKINKLIVVQAASWNDDYSILFPNNDLLKCILI